MTSAPDTMTNDDQRQHPAGTSAPLVQYSTSLDSAAAVTVTSGSVVRGRNPRRSAIVLYGAVVPVALLAAWWGIAASGIVPAYRLPSPAEVWQAGVDLTATGQLGQYSAISTQRVILGFLIGSALGLVLGSIVGLSRWASAFLSPTIGAFRAVPSLAWVPLLVLYIGINEDSKVTLIAVGALFPVYTNVAGALRHVDLQLVELGRAYGLGRWALLTRVQLPAVIPTIVSGLRLALAQSWLFLVAAELIASSMGLGFLLLDSQNNGRLDRIFLAIIVLAIIGKATDALLGLLERYLLRRWG